MRKLPPRSRVAESDTWDLRPLFKSDKAWEKSLKEFESQVEGFAKFRGKLSRSAKSLRGCLDLDDEVDRLGSRLGCYAFLRSCTDQTESGAQRMLGRFQNVATRAGEAASFIRPEIMAIPAAKMKKFLASKELADYQLLLKRMLRFKKHTLSDKEEQLLAMQGEMAGAASSIFNKLLDADMKFGTVKDEKGKEVELSNATLSQFLQSTDRNRIVWRPRSRAPFKKMSTTPEPEVTTVHCTRRCSRTTCLNPFTTTWWLRSGGICLPFIATTKYVGAR